MKDIAATNYSALHALVDGDRSSFARCSTTCQGAAGGSIQWATVARAARKFRLTAPAQDGSDDERCNERDRPCTPISTKSIRCLFTPVKGSGVARERRAAAFSISMAAARSRRSATGTRASEGSRVSTRPRVPDERSVRDEAAEAPRRLAHPDWDACSSSTAAPRRTRTLCGSR
jgi:hypothetical protein